MNIISRQPEITESLALMKRRWEFSISVVGISQCFIIYKAFYSDKSGDGAAKLWSRAEEASSDYCFPNKLEDIKVLTRAIQQNPKGAKAYYYLGNLYYDKMQYEKAVELWEQSSALDSHFPIVLRNLALAYYNKQQKL